MSRCMQSCRRQKHTSGRRSQRAECEEGSQIARAGDTQVKRVQWSQRVHTRTAQKGQCNGVSQQGVHDEALEPYARSSE
jgi:hypothetical protein